MESNRPESKAAKNETAARSTTATTAQQWATGLGTWLALTLSALTLCLTLLGYGHELSYLNTFGLRPEELQRTPLDFLLRSWHPAAEVVASLKEMLTLEHFITLWKALWQKAWMAVVVSVLVGGVVGGLYAKSMRRSRQAQKTLSPGKEAGKPTPGWLASFIRWARDPSRWWAWAGGAVWVGFFAGPTLLKLTIGGVGVLFVVIFGALPVAGAKSGTSRAQDEVLAPVGCVGQKLAKGHDGSKLARCITVTRDKEIARGHLIDYGMGRVFIYEPCSRRSLSVPLEQTVVQQMESLGDCSL